MYYPNSNDWWLDPSQGRFDLRANGAVPPLLSVTANGNVGIGTTNPIYPLHIKSGGSNDAGLQVDGTNTNSAYLTFMNAGGRVWIGEDNSAGNNLAGTGGIAYNLGMHAYGAAQPLQFTTNGAVRMTIRETGSVGIGTTSPGFALDVNGIIRASGSIYTNYLNSSSGGTSMKIGTGGDDAQIFLQANGNTPGAGHVGIGTTSPGAKLDVGLGVAPQAAGVRIDARYNGSGPGLKILANTRALGESLVEVDNNGGTPNLVVLANGNVGIGTPSPGAKLDVTGTVKATSFSGDGSGLTGVSAGKVLQVVQSSYSTETNWGGDGNTYSDEGLSATITPHSASNNVLVAVSLPAYSATGSGDVYMNLRILRNSNPIFNLPTTGVGGVNTTVYSTAGGQYLDSPATTATTTYKVQVAGFSGTNTLQKGGRSSIITLYEIAP